MFSQSSRRGRTGRRLAVGSAGLLVASSALTAGLQATAQAAPPTCFGKVASIVGSARGTTIRGTRGVDVIYAGNGNDTVLAAGGDDLICGGYGADRLRGGPGDDRIEGNQGARAGGRIDGDTLEGDGGDDFLSPGFDARLPTRRPDRITFGSSARPVTVNTATRSATGQGSDTWLGDRAEIIGSGFGDRFVGGPGNDTFQGGGGADTISGSGGTDVLRDDYVAGRDADHLDGGPGNDQLFTRGGFDSLMGGDGDDLLSDYGRDAGSMSGGTGNDVINDGIAISRAQFDDGGPGVDRVALYTDMSRNTWPRLYVDLAAGTGTFKGFAPFTIRSTDKLFVHGASLTFRGDSGDNLAWTDGSNGLAATGLAGNDTFVGGIADDRFDGGPGRDGVNTRGGRNTCVSIEKIIGGPCPAG